MINIVSWVIENQVSRGRKTEQEFEIASRIFPNTAIGSDEYFTPFSEVAKMHAW